MNTDYKNHDENASSQTATKSAVPVVYIANIPFNMTKEGLAALFKLKSITATVFRFNIYIIRQTHIWCSILYIINLYFYSYL